MDIQLRRSAADFSEIVQGFGMFPNKILQKVSKAEVLQNARVGTAVHCLPEWQAPMWVLTGFACYSARKSRSYHAGFRKCSYTCCACYSPFPMLASAISLIGNRRQLPPCLPKSETDGSQWRRSSAFSGADAPPLTPPEGAVCS